MRNFETESPLQLRPPLRPPSRSPGSSPVPPVVRAPSDGSNVPSLGVAGGVGRARSVPVTVTHLRSVQPRELRLQRDHAKIGAEHPRGPDRARAGPAWTFFITVGSASSSCRCPITVTISLRCSRARTSWGAGPRWSSTPPRSKIRSQPSHRMLVILAAAAPSVVSLIASLPSSD